MKISLYILLISIIISSTCFSDIQTNDKGMRKLTSLPPAGVHPRVYFTAQDYPDIQNRMQNTEFGKIMRPIIGNVIKNRRPSLEKIAAINEPTIEDIEKYFRPDEQRNIQWGMISLDAVLKNDTEIIDLMSKAVTGYYRILLASKDMKEGGLSSEEPVKNSTRYSISGKQTSLTYPQAGFLVLPDWL
jgi:hypothetical protein